MCSSDLINAFHFVKHLAGLNFSDVVLRITLAVTHPDFSRLFRDRLVREDADPDTAAPFDMTSHGAACRFDLARSQAAAAYGLETEFAKTDLVAASRNAGVAALLLLAVFSSSWLACLAPDFLAFFSGSAAVGATSSC